MKTITFVTALSLLAAPVLFAGQASAAEGGHDPFALTTPGITTNLRAGVAGSNQNPYPYGAPAVVESLATTPEGGSEAGYNTANSLPSVAPVATPARNRLAQR